ncbi:hypothetical protein HW115_19015 [Verrucomicrobiaceae bacterium N1E253]|uniref:Uncharacterized protein n=1 Tax=Oceaniferula marina TaxID=2748318 RepID=A0A851GRR7_9BACT|nr:hypothetical protein [Oceaniferula marina]NWK57717.1 hypothetical protein [Oceaniferula marina]
MQQRPLKIILYLLLGLTLFISISKFFREDTSYQKDAQMLKNRLSELKVDLQKKDKKSEEYQELEQELNEMESKLDLIISREQKEISFDFREDILDPLFIIVLISLLPMLNNKQNKSQHPTASS